MNVCPFTTKFADVLLARSAVDLLLLPHSEQRCEVRSAARGSAFVTRDGDVFRYERVTGDPLSLGDDVLSALSPARRSDGRENRGDLPGLATGGSAGQADRTHRTRVANLAAAASLVTWDDRWRPRGGGAPFSGGHTPGAATPRLATVSLPLPPFDWAQQAKAHEYEERLCVPVTLFAAGWRLPCCSNRGRATDHGRLQSGHS